MPIANSNNNVAAETKVFTVIITVKDSVSTKTVNTYTITLNIDNDNNAPFFKGTSKVLTGWTVGVVPTTLPSLTVTNLFDDKDPGDAAALKFSTCTLT